MHAYGKTRGRALMMRAPKRATIAKDKALKNMENVEESGEQIGRSSKTQPKVSVENLGKMV